MRTLLPALLLSLVASAASAAEPPIAIPEGDALRAEILARDLAFFELQFERCEPPAMRAMLTDDVEFYHDKGGRVQGADAFVAMYEKACNERKAPDAWRSRRVLVEASLHVDPVPGYGAMETGEHTFHERQGEGPQKLVGRAKFAIVWQRAAESGSPPLRSGGREVGEGA